MHQMTAQTKVEKSQMEASIALNTMNTNSFRTEPLEYKDIKGSPYLMDKASIGYLILVKGDWTEEALLQYDIYREEFFHVNDNEEQQILKQSVIDEIIINDSEESYRFKRVNPDLPMRFYDIIYESPSLVIYNDPEINLYEGKEQGVNKIDPRFSRQNNLYAIKEGGSPKKIKIKEKEILNLMSGAQKQGLQKYLKSNKIKLKKLNVLKNALSAFEQ